MEILLLLRAENDSQEIFEYLEDLRGGRGEQFLSELERTLGLIGENPEIGPFYRRKHRRKVMTQFPFGILYSVEGNRILVSTIAHLRQDPEKVAAILDRLDL